MTGVPVMLLALEGAVRCVPAAEVDGLLFTVSAPLRFLGFAEIILELLLNLFDVSAELDILFGRVKLSA